VDKTRKGRIWSPRGSILKDFSVPRRRYPLLDAPLGCGFCASPASCEVRPIRGVRQTRRGRALAIHFLDDQTVEPQGRPVSGVIGEGPVATIGNARQRLRPARQPTCRASPARASGKAVAASSPPGHIPARACRRRLARAGNQPYTQKATNVSPT
jgi:hypothetical protein